MRRYALRDDQWDRIRDLLPGREDTVGVTARDNRLFVEAVLYRYRTGMPWCDLPERFGDGVQVHRRFSRWAKSGVWERVFQYLAADADDEYAMIDSTIVRAHQHSAGAKKRRRGRGDRAIAWRTEHQDPHHGRCTWKPGGFLSDRGQAHDLEGTDHVSPSMQADTLIADKAFDADARVIAPLEAAEKPP
jgi:transposase